MNHRLSLWVVADKPHAWKQFDGLLRFPRDVVVSKPGQLIVVDQSGVFVLEISGSVLFKFGLDTRTFYDGICYCGITRIIYVTSRDKGVVKAIKWSLDQMNVRYF